MMWSIQYLDAVLIHCIFSFGIKIDLNRKCIQYLRLVKLLERQKMLEFKFYTRIYSIHLNAPTLLNAHILRRCSRYVSFIY